jgi:hypothetical protein
MVTRQFSDLILARDHIENVAVVTAINQLWTPGGYRIILYLKKKRAERSACNTPSSPDQIACLEATLASLKVPALSSFPQDDRPRSHGKLGTELEHRPLASCYPAGRQYTQLGYDHQTDWCSARDLDRLNRRAS